MVLNSIEKMKKSFSQDFWPQTKNSSERMTTKKQRQLSLKRYNFGTTRNPGFTGIS